MTDFDRQGRSRLAARLGVAALVLAGSTGLGATAAAAAPAGTAGGGADPAAAGSQPAASGSQPAAAGITHPDLDFMGWSRRGTKGPTTGGITSLAAVVQTPGIDVSHFQGTVNWAAKFSSGIRFTWIKATEGVRSATRRSRPASTNALQAGVIRGAYHFALPDRSTGATQASFLVAHGGALVPRRPDPAGDAGHRVQPVRRDLLREDQGRHDGLDPRLREPRTRRGPAGPR